MQGHFYPQKAKSRASTSVTSVKRAMAPGCGRGSGQEEPFENVILWGAHKKQGGLGKRGWQRGSWGKPRDSELIKANWFNYQSVCSKEPRWLRFLQSWGIKWHFWLWQRFSLEEGSKGKMKSIIFWRFRFCSKTFSLRNAVSWVLWRNKFREL